jgi:hypothetical protein
MGSAVLVVGRDVLIAGTHQVRKTSERSSLMTGLRRRPSLRPIRTDDPAGREPVSRRWLIAISSVRRAVAAQAGDIAGLGADARPGLDEPPRPGQAASVEERSS